MKMKLNKEIDAMKRETAIRKELNTKTLDRKLTELDFFERSSQMFEPLLDSNVKVQENLKTLEEGLKQQNIQHQQAIEENSSSIPKVKLEPKKTFAEESGGNSWFKEANGSYYLASEKSKTPRFKVVNGKIIFSKDNNDYIVDITDGLNELLFVKDFDEQKVTKEDVEQYYRLYGQLGVKEGNSKRARKIHKAFPNVDREHYVRGGTGFNTDKTIPKTKKAVKNRIKVLLASKSFGQENVNKELNNLINYITNTK